MSSTVYLITGANRGLGQGLLKTLILRPNTTVVAGVRDPSHATSKGLAQLPAAKGSKVIVVKIDSSSDKDAAEAVKTLESTHGIAHIDVVIANAGIGSYYGPVATTPVSEFRDHYEINTIAPILLFQATVALLKKSAKPKFVTVSSGVGSIGDIEKVPLPNGAYGSSKASLNFVTRKVHFENEDIIAFPINPGWVQTDMGTTGAKSNGMEEAPVTVQDSVDGMLDKIDNATKEKTSGTFQDFSGEFWNW